MPRPLISLRPFTHGDRPFFTRLATDRQVTRFIGDGEPWDAGTISSRVDVALRPVPVIGTGAARWFLARDGQQAVGLLVVTRGDYGVEIGYWVSPDHWGRRIAGSMIEQAKMTVPELSGCGTLLARVRPDNAASARVLLRHGFRLTSSDGHHDLYTCSPCSPPRKD